MIIINLPVHLQLPIIVITCLRFHDYLNKALCSRVIPLIIQLILPVNLQRKQPPTGVDTENLKRWAEKMWRECNHTPYQHEYQLNMNMNIYSKYARLHILY